MKHNCKECGTVLKDITDKEYIRDYINSLVTEARYDKVLYSMDDDIGITASRLPKEDAERINRELDEYRRAVERMFGSLHRIGLIAGTDIFGGYDNDATSRNDYDDDYYEGLE